MEWKDIHIPEDMEDLDIVPPPLYIAALLMRLKNRVVLMHIYILVVQYK